MGQLDPPYSAVTLRVTNRQASKILNGLGTVLASTAAVARGKRTVATKTCPWSLRSKALYDARLQFGWVKSFRLQMGERAARVQAVPGLPAASRRGRRCRRGVLSSQRFPSAERKSTSRKGRAPVHDALLELGSTTVWGHPGKGP